MSKRRRSSGNRKVAEAKFWGVRLAGPATGPADVDAAADGDETVTGRGPATPTGAAEPRRPAAEVVAVVRPTPDPGALVRSLGPPPLAVDGGVAERHLTAVYEEAVRTATALAAANGLLGSGDDDS